MKNSSSAIYAELQRLAAANFAGGMKRQMETLGGVASNLVDTWQSFMRAVGTKGLGRVSSGNSVAHRMVG